MQNFTRRQLEPSTNDACMKNCNTSADVAVVLLRLFLWPLITIIDKHVTNERWTKTFYTGGCGIGRYSARGRTIAVADFLYQLVLLICYSDMSLEKFNENDMKCTVGNPHNPYFYAGCIIYTHFWTFEALIKIWPDANFLLIF